MTPFGYRIVNAKAVVEPDEARKLKDFFERFLEGGQIQAAAKEAKITKSPPTCKRMLSNPVYLGTDFYPQIIEPERFEKVQERLKERCRKKKGSRVIPELPVYTSFVACPVAIDSEGMDPSEYAARQFAQIRAVW